jgi:hypothetical protein
MERRRACHRRDMRAPVADPDGEQGACRGQASRSQALPRVAFLHLRSESSRWCQHSVCSGGHPRELNTEGPVRGGPAGLRGPGRISQGGPSSSRIF